MYNLLIVDDKIEICQSLKTNFEQNGFNVRYALNITDALNIFRENVIHLTILDVMLNGESGLELLKLIRNLDSGQIVIMITGYATVEVAVEAMKLGALDYLKKPVKFPMLLKLVMRAVEGLKPESSLKAGLKGSDFITENSAMKELIKKAARLAETDLPVLICGESGTGKEYFAELIHRYSNRSANELHKINCAAFPESLLDNELFGHDKGAFTGASAEYKGIFERADGSTLFLDELGDMPLSIQAKILRVIQNAELRRLGGHKTLKVDVRFIAATNRDLQTMIREEKFREDLFYRLNMAPLAIPPLRKRPDDIPYLIDSFLQESGRTLAPRVREILCNHDWPGNVRELKSCIFYAAAVSTGSVITLNDLPSSFASPDLADVRTVRDDQEKRKILRALERTGYNKTRAAEYLMVSRATLYNKMVKYGISTIR